ncbi:NACHT domain-containing protein [Fusarium sp. Ph1]|nr:NACHT domain-containing protein [Fusarium sp. Ph1]
MASRNCLDSPDSYAVAWIAALPIERAAAKAMLDEEHAAPTGFARHQTDANVYTWGRVGEHNIVIASLPAGVYGTTSAATTASGLLASLPSIRVGLLVGIGGGIARPDDDRDIRLGDIVVSQPDGTAGGVCQYDLTKAKTGDRRERKGFLGRPPAVLLNALASIQADHELEDSKVPCFLQQMLEKNPKMSKRSKQSPGYAHQGFDNDRLFGASSGHVPGPDCRGCDAAGEVQRDPRDTTDPDIHYGTIASGNTLVKDAAARDRIIADVGEDCICFEMEAAGLMNHFPCLVIRGICDYADSHKNDRWQRYASATAAAYAKELLAYVPAAEVQETKRALEVLQSVQQQIDGVQQTAVATKAATDSIRSDLRTDKIKRWLYPPDPSTNANHARKLRHEGTGAWLLENPVFQEWYSGSRRYLWLYGLAGCGKTVLSATMLDHLAKGSDRLILSFFFDFSDTAKQTLDGMLRSLAFQLYQGGAGSASLLNNSFQAHQDGRDQPATKALSDVLFKMLAVQKKVSIVLDALDESTTRGELLLWIKDVVSKPELRHVQLICTGRPEPEFMRGIPSLIGEDNCLALDKDSVNADIRSYVAAQLSQRRDFRDKPLSQDLLEEIRKKVGNGADGMFRWAFCQLDSLARCRHEAAIEEALLSLPQSLEDTYRRMIECIPTELKTDAIRLLQFLVHSERPLRLAEAKEVIATQIENESRGFNIKRRLFCDTDVLDYCPSLVTVVHDTDRELHLAHFSVKEYLLRENQFKVITASIPITRTCLTYLTDINGGHREIKQDFPMARYAAEVWTSYAVVAQASEDIARATATFLEEEATFQRWARLYQPDRDWDDNPGSPRGSRLYYACFVGLVAPVRDLIGKGADVNAQGGEYGNALQAAAFGGHQEIVELLLAQGADINAQGDRFGNAFQAAAFGGHQEIITLLLDKGADVNAQGGYYGNALYAAAVEGHQEIVELLLDKGADINAQGGYYGNALYAAAVRGHLEIVELLLAQGADINAQGGNCGNALQAAAVRGHLEIVELLLDKGADINAQGGYYGNALYAAAVEGHQEIVELLLDKGADINAQGGDYGNALQAAAVEGHLEIARLLLDKGADVNAQGGDYGNALQAAAVRGHLEIARLLLDKGADVNAPGGDYGLGLWLGLVLTI